MFVISGSRAPYRPSMQSSRECSRIDKSAASIFYELPKKDKEAHKTQLYEGTSSFLCAVDRMNGLRRSQIGVGALFMNERRMHEWKKNDPRSSIANEMVLRMTLRMHFRWLSSRRCHCAQLHRSVCYSRMPFMQFFCESCVRHCFVSTHCRYWSGRLPLDHCLRSIVGLSFCRKLCVSG